MERRLDEPRPGGDLPVPLPFVLLFLLPVGAAVLLFELLGGLPEGWGFYGLLLGPGVIVGLLSRWACKRYRVEGMMGWSIVLAASGVAVACALLALFAFAIAHSE